MPNQRFYLSTIGPFGNGQSAAQPLDASTQLKLDSIWAQYLNTNGGRIEFHYAPGLYQTKGAIFGVFGGDNAYSGNYHYGSGQSATTIQLVGASNATTDGQIFGTPNHPNWLSGWGCFDMTLDCNSVNQPKWQNALGAMAAIAFTGGDNITIQRVTVINCGTPKLGVECFPIAIFPSNFNRQSHKMVNILIDNVTIMSPPTGNLDGTSSIAISDGPSSVNGITPTPITCDSSCVISNCQFLDLNIGSGFTYIHCAAAPTVINCFARNSGTFYYQEPVNFQYSGAGILVNNNICVNMNRLVHVLFHVDSGSSAQFTNVAITNNTISYPVDTTSSIGVQFTGGGVVGAVPARVNNVTIRNNQFISNSTQVNPEGVYIYENSNLDETIQEVDIIGNYFQSFSTSQNKQITLDPSTAIIVTRMISGNQYPSPLP